MKIRNLILTISCVLLIQPSFANITVMSLKAGDDICANLAGVWAGSGVVKASIISCEYSGTVTVLHGDLPTAYTAVANLKLDSGMCPETMELKMTGSCTNNQLVLENADTNMSGSVDETGRLANLSGDVYFNVWGERLHADLEDVRLQKQD